MWKSSLVGLLFFCSYLCCTDRQCTLNIIIILLMDELISVLQLFFRSSVSKLSLDVVILSSLLYPKSVVTSPISNMEGATILYPDLWKWSKWSVQIVRGFMFRTNLSLKKTYNGKWKTTHRCWILHNTDALWIKILNNMLILSSV